MGIIGISIFTDKDVGAQGGSSLSEVMMQSLLGCSPGSRAYILLAGGTPEFPGGEPLGPGHQLPTGCVLSPPWLVVPRRGRPVLWAAWPDASGVGEGGRPQEGSRESHSVPRWTDPTDGSRAVHPCFGLSQPPSLRQNPLGVLLLWVP